MFEDLFIASYVQEVDMEELEELKKNPDFNRMADECIEILLKDLTYNDFSLEEINIALNRRYGTVIEVYFNTTNKLYYMFYGTR